MLNALVLCHFFIGTFGTSLNDASRLREYLFNTNSYDKKSRPMFNQLVPTEVTIDFSLSAIYDLNEVSQTLTTAGFLDIRWLDEALQWDPRDYGNITGAMYPQCDVWRPDVALQNSIQDFKELGIPSLNVFTDNQGNVAWQPYQVFMSTCKVDISYFPFDVQTCHLIFVTWSYTREQIRLIRGHSDVSLKHFQVNSEWDLVETSSHISDDVTPSVTFSLVLKRKPAHVINNIVLPIVILTVLNLCVFLLPSDSGEKASYAITVFLSFAVFSTIVNSTLPETAENMPLLSLYASFQTVQSSVITIIALVLIRLQKSTRPVPLFLRSLLNVKPQERHARNKVDPAIGNDTTDELAISDVTTMKENGNHDVGEKAKGKVFTVIQGNKKHEENFEFHNQVVSVRQDVITEQLMKIGWSDVTNLLDKILFFAFLSLSCLSALTLMLVSFKGNGN